MKLLDNQKTVYDVEKIVAELESFAKLAEDRWVNGTSNRHSKKRWGVMRTIYYLIAGFALKKAMKHEEKFQKWNMKFGKYADKIRREQDIDVIRGGNWDE